MRSAKSRGCPIAKWSRALQNAKIFLEVSTICGEGRYEVNLAPAEKFGMDEYYHSRV